MNLTEEQTEKMGSTFETVLEYKELAKGHNSAATEALKDLLEEFCPKPAGKMDAAAKADFKKQRAETKQFIGDTLREYVREKENKPDTTAEALVASEKLIKK